MAGLLAKIELSDRDVAYIRSCLSQFEEDIIDEATKRGLVAGGKVLLEGVKRRMPAHTGTARDSLRMRNWVTKNKMTRGVTIEFETDKILDNAPFSRTTRGHRFFYPATIEYGRRDINRPAVAPIRKTEEADGPKAVNEVVLTIEEFAAKKAKALGLGG